MNIDSLVQITGFSHIKRENNPFVDGSFWYKFIV